MSPDEVTARGQAGLGCGLCGFALFGVPVIFAVIFAVGAGLHAIF